MNMGRIKVRRGASETQDAKLAVRELYEQISQPDISVIFFFCSSQYKLKALASELKNFFGDTLIIGCTTAGEITSERGYKENSLVGVSISGNDFNVYANPIKDLASFNEAEVEEMVTATKKKLHISGDFNYNAFGFLLIDGLSLLEERVIAMLSNGFTGLPIVGGSAGDNLFFKATTVYVNGEFLSNAAVFTIVKTSVPFRTFKTQHFQPSDKKLVITAADPSKRVVTEINGVPAAEEYASIVGIDMNELSSQVFSTHPVMLKIAGEYYVRSIQKVNDDKSLTFYCAIDTGLVLTIARGVDMLDNLKNKLAELHSELGDISLILGCDCILRKLEIKEKKLQKQIENLFKKVNFIGFSTYGEQCDIVHVNQTLTGIAFGE